MEYYDSLQRMVMIYMQEYPTIKNDASRFTGIAEKNASHIITADNTNKSSDDRIRLRYR